MFGRLFSALLIAFALVAPTFAGTLPANVYRVTIRNESDTCVQVRVDSLVGAAGDYSAWGGPSYLKPRGTVTFTVDPPRPVLKVTAEFRNDGECSGFSMTSKVLEEPTKERVSPLPQNIGVIFQGTKTKYALVWASP